MAPDTAADRYLHGAYHPNGHCPNGVCAELPTCSRCHRKIITFDGSRPTICGNCHPR